MIALHNITVRIGDVTLIDGVSAAVRPGQLTAVVGPNGAGKTTLLRVATGELEPSAGTVAMDDRPLGALPERDFPTLSGGEQQRVHLARALAQIWTPPDAGHRYLLLDEPTASLDLAHQHQVLQTAAGLVADGVGVLAILHDLNLAAQYADHVVMLRRGTLHAKGPPGDVLTPAGVEDVFGCPVRVIAHPTQPCPLIVPDAATHASTPAVPTA